MVGPGEYSRRFMEASRFAHIKFIARREKARHGVENVRRPHIRGFHGDPDVAHGVQVIAGDRGSHRGSFIKKYIRFKDYSNVQRYVIGSRRIELGRGGSCVIHLPRLEGDYNKLLDKFDGSAPSGSKVP